MDGSPFTVACVRAGPCKTWCMAYSLYSGVCEVKAEVFRLPCWIITIWITSQQEAHLDADVLFIPCTCPSFSPHCHQVWTLTESYQTENESGKIHFYLSLYPKYWVKCMNLVFYENRTLSIHLTISQSRLSLSGLQRAETRDLLAVKRQCYTILLFLLQNNVYLAIKGEYRNVRLSL